MKVPVPVVGATQVSVTEVAEATVAVSEVGALGAVLAAGRGEHVPTHLLNQLLGPEHGRGLDATLLVQLSGMLEGSLRHVFDIIAGLSVASLGAGLLFPEKRLSQPDSGRTASVAGE